MDEKQILGQILFELQDLENIGIGLICLLSVIIIVMTISLIVNACKDR